MPMLTDHETVAAEIAATTPTAPTVTRCWRQGDVLFRRRRGRARRGKPTPVGGVIIVAGAHGQHRLIAPSATVTYGEPHIIIEVPDGGLVVHTDAPSARHESRRLAPGVWSAWQCQELAGEQIVPVRD